MEHEMTTKGIYQYIGIFSLSLAHNTAPSNPCPPDFYVASSSVPFSPPEGSLAYSAYFMRPTPFPLPIPSSLSYYSIFISSRH